MLPPLKSYNPLKCSPLDMVENGREYTPKTIWYRNVKVSTPGKSSESKTSRSTNCGQSSLPPFVPAREIGIAEQDCD